MFAGCDNGTCLHDNGPAQNQSMSESKKEEPGSRGAAAFAYRDFRLYQMARALVIMGAEAQAVAVAWQVYLITHRAIDLGYTGLALFLPGLIFMLPAGHTALPCCPRLGRQQPASAPRSADCSSRPRTGAWSSW